MYEKLIMNFGRLKKNSKFHSKRTEDFVNVVLNSDSTDSTQIKAKKNLEEIRKK